MASDMSEKEKAGGWGLILTGTLMLIYLLGALVIGKLGFSVFLGEATAAIVHMNVQAAITLWTGIYIAATFIILGLGIYLEFYS